MSADSSTASSADMIEEQKRERESLERNLDDIVQRIRGGASGQEVNAALRRVRLRMIALARSEGWLAWMMRPDDAPVGDNVVRFRRPLRVR